MMRSKSMMKMRKIYLKHLKKLTVDKVQDEVTDDSVKQIEVKQYPCDECEYYVKYLNNLKRHILAQQEGVKSSYDQCS